MGRRLIVRTKCPLCGEEVEAVPDGVLKKNPGYHDAEMVVTKTWYKIYIHSSCRHRTIEKQKLEAHA